MQAYVWIAAGGAIGSVARHWCGQMVTAMTAGPFPWGTLLVNVIGSFIIGLFAALTGPDGRMVMGETARQFVMVGILGGYTTFSAFSFQTLRLAQDGNWLQAGGNIAGSLVLCLGAVWLGHVTAVALNAR